MEPMRRKTQPVYTRTSEMFASMADFLMPGRGKFPEEGIPEKKEAKCECCGSVLFDKERQTGVCVDCFEKTDV